MRFKSCDDKRGGGVERVVARGYANVPALRAPFAEFVVCKGAGGDSVDGSPLEMPREKELEDVGFAGARRRVDNGVFALAEGAYCFALPEVGEFYAVSEFFAGGL